jgi:hypothetical protein
MKKNNKKNGNSNISVISAILELVKYLTKSNDYLIRDGDGNIDEDKTDEAVHNLSSSLANRRLISFGGVLRDKHKELHLDDIDDGDLLHTEVGEKAGLIDFVEYKCTWKGKSGYDVKPKKDE